MNSSSQPALSALWQLFFTGILASATAFSTDLPMSNSPESSEDRSQTSEQAAAAFRIWLDLSLEIIGLKSRAQAWLQASPLEFHP